MFSCIIASANEYTCQEIPVLHLEVMKKLLDIQDDVSKM